MIKILIADDHAVVLEGLKRIIADAADMAIEAEAKTGREVLEKLRTTAVDLVLLDLSMPKISGLELLKVIKDRYPKIPVLILSMLPENQYAVRMLKAGASGYLNKASAADQLILAIRKVAYGGKYISMTLAEKLAFDLDINTSKPPHETLSNREYQVFCLIASGKQAAEIADELTLSAKTVSTYRARVLEKMKMSNNAELIRYAIENNLVL